MEQLDIRDAIRSARAVGLENDQIGYLFELTAGEVERIEAGDLSAWEAKDSPDDRRRLVSRLKATVREAERRLQQHRDQAQVFNQPAALDQSDALRRNA